MRDLSLHILDIVQNSISAEATRVSITLEVCPAEDKLRIVISDNGCGMDEELLRRVENPFVTTRTTRKVGLGIPLMKESAEMAGGGLAVNSSKAEDTTITVDFRISHIDRLPLGDVAETVKELVAAYPEIWWLIEFKNEKNIFMFDTEEIKSKLGNVSITEYEVLTWIKEYLEEGIKLIFGGVLDEVDS